jgi:N-methylhydantoinase A
MNLAIEAAKKALNHNVAEPLGLSLDEAALAVIDLATEQMVNAIEDITVKQGIDPAGTTLVSGGGAAGINAAQIAKRLGCHTIVVPGICAALSAAGAMMSELTRDFSIVAFMPTGKYEAEKAKEIISSLEKQADAFIAAAGSQILGARVEFAIEGRYPSQVWEIEVPVHRDMIEGANAANAIVEAFHRRHTELFSFRDDGDEVEIMSWRAIARCRVAASISSNFEARSEHAPQILRRTMTFRETGTALTPAFHWDALEAGEAIAGPAVIESCFTTVVVNPSATAIKQPGGHLVIRL